MRLAVVEGKGIELSQSESADSVNQHPHRPLFCPFCLEHKVRTPVELYRKQALRYCTYHYWLMRGRVNPGGYTLKDYVEVSKRHNFTVSLPSGENIRIMEKSNHAESLKQKLAL